MCAYVREDNARALAACMFTLCIVRYLMNITLRCNKYRLLYGRGVPLGHIGTGVAISARGPIWLSSANMI